MANVGSGSSGQTLIGAGNGASPTFAAIGTNSGLTAHGVVISEGNSAFASATPGPSGTVFASNGTLNDPSFQTTSSLGLITTITGNSGGAQSPSSGNFNILGTGSITIVGTANTETVQLTGLTNHNVLIGAGSATITKVAPSSTSGVPLISQGSSADPAFGTAVVAGGGTGQVTLTNHGVLVGAGTSAISQTATGSAGQVLQSGGASADPTYSTPTYPSTSGTSGKVLISDGTNNVYSTPTFPNTSATSGKIIISDGTNWIASTPTYPNTSGTAGKVVVSDGTNNVYSTPTFPNASATSRKIIVSDGTNWVASTETWATPGTSGNVLTSNGTNWTSAAPASNFSPNGTIQLSDDFINWQQSSILLSSQLGWNVSISNFLAGGTSVASGHPGVLTNPAISSGFTYLCGVAPGSSFILGGGALTINWVFKINTLSTGTNRYILTFGISDFAGSTSDQANGCYFYYSDNVNSGNWNYVTAAASSRTTSTSSTAADTNWHNAQVSINAAGTSVSFFIDGVSLGTANTTNIPTLGTGPFFSINRTVGTVAANSIEIDLFYCSQTLTSPR